MIINRRELIGSVAATSVLYSLPMARAVVSSRVQPDVCIVDSNLQGSSDMIACFDVGPSIVHTFAGDPGTAWMNELEPLLRRRVVTVAGYTSAPTLFCLQYLARAYGLELSGYAEGANAPAAFADAESAVGELIELHSRNEQRSMTWLLAPRRG